MNHLPILIPIPEDLRLAYERTAPDAPATYCYPSAHTHALIERIAALTAENEHLAEAHYLCDRLDGIKRSSEYATCTDEEFKEAMEYGESCRCHVCEFARYVLTLRAERDALKLRIAAMESDRDPHKWRPVGNLPGYEQRINETGNLLTRPIKEEVKL